ncbi:DHS-like NAD/FAD-binding domain-containing protein [Coniochaeta sp. 2T2.1]|nr:DHS-like NAD/FAD-binding domain-containing protein [Coniochaeta sp. 2T2.1]
MFLRDLAAKSKPTLTHQWLASLGDKLLRLYTQNIDMLEDKAGLKTGLGRQFNCVQLHGTIANLQCNLCKEVYPWETFRDDINLSRDSLYTRGTDRSKAREASVGLFRPDMVMLDGPSPDEVGIAELARNDCASEPQVFLILGTSLKADGPKTLARQFARRVRACGCMVAYVNQTKPSRAWKDLIDYWVEWNCDE